jgi:DNA-directed RNA polymerase subunit RPC12/RpoP
MEVKRIEDKYKQVREGLKRKYAFIRRGETYEPVLLCANCGKMQQHKLIAQNRYKCGCCGNRRVWGNAESRVRLGQAE